MPKEFKKKTRGGARQSRSDKRKNETDEPIVDAVVVGSASDAFTSNADFVSLDDTPAATADAGPSRSSKRQENKSDDNNITSNAFVPGPTAAQVEIDLNAPFGFVDPDIKAYFRSVDEKLVEFASLGLAKSQDQDVDEEDVESELEDRTNFLHSALEEVRGLELKLATDGDTALVLERLIHSMGDWGRRVLMDSFSGRWRPLIEHRFGSHVCQTLIGLAGETIDREARGVFPKQHQEQQASSASASSSTTNPPQGQLRTATQLVLDLINELIPSIPQLLTSPFASPPIRLLLIVLSPHKSIPSSTSNPSVQQELSGSSTDAASKIRSKKSQRFRSNQVEGGKMRSIVGEDDAPGTDVKGKKRGERIVPEQLREMRRAIRKDLERRLSGAEWRAMGVENAGGPVIQMLVEIEAEDEDVMREGSILDQLTSGLVAEQVQPSPPEPTSHDFLPSLLRDTTGSHLLQTILLFAPTQILNAIWKTYFVGKIGKLSIHPIGNYVVSSGIKRLDVEGIKEVMRELEAVGASSVIRTARTSVLKALVDRSVELGQGQQEVVTCICKAFELETFPEKKMFVPCALTLNVLKAYKAATSPAGGAEVDANEEAPSGEQKHGWKPRQPKREREPLEPTMQGALLIQAMFDLDAPAIETVINSLLGQTVDDLIAMSHHAITSHVLDAFLISPKVAAKWKRKLLLAFDGRYLDLVCDKFGSRVGDTIWDRAADGFMKEKIAKSLLPHAIALSNNQYGRFFYKRLNLPMYESRPKEWREVQLKVVHHFYGPKTAVGEAAVRETKPQVAAAAAAGTETPSNEIAGPTSVEAAADAEQKPVKKEKKEKKSKKRSRDSEDEIDDLFAEVVSDKKKKKKKSKQV